MRATIAILALSFPFWAAGGPSYAQNAPGHIRWKAEHEGAIARGPEKANPAEVLDATRDRHLVLQFKKLPNEKEKAKLEGKGVTLLRYLGDNAFFAKVKDGKQANAQAFRSGLHAASQIKRDWKLHRRLIRGDVPEYARFPATAAPGHEPKNGNAAAPEEIVALYILFHPDVDLDKTGVATVGNHGGSVRSLLRSINGAVIWLPLSQLGALADEDVVQWVEPPLPPMSVTNNGVRTAIQAQLLQAPPFELDGTGVPVMVYDGGTVMSSHADLQERTFIRDNSGVSDHPTHVAGIIGGDGTASGGNFAGMAPKVTIQSFGFEYDGTGQFLYTNPGDLEADYNKALNTYGVMIANNSIGTNVAPNGYPCDWEGDYGTTDILIDSLVRGSLGSPMRVIWANGNERGSGRCGVEYRTTAPPACAKNHITVGAINSNDFSMTSFSSWGPTDDGRIKPDVCAPGCQVGDDNGVTSTVSSGSYGVMCGTSMAAPAVTGVAALLLQDWKERFPYEPLPPNAMLKVLFTHNAMDLGSFGPDYRFGFGAVRGVDTVSFLQTGSFAQGTVDHGQQLLYFVPVTQPGTPLKVTLAWDDVPGAVNTVPELVNDLDLKVISPSGVTHYPWTLDPANPSLPAVRTAEDHSNNIEQVVVDSAETGGWQVVVDGYAIPSGPQPFSLAASPTLKSCSSSGLIVLKSPKYSCSSDVLVTVKDCDLDIDPQAVETVTVTVSSSSEPGGESVVLTETSATSATFEGSLSTSTTDASGLLLVANGDTLTATYLDADDGQGGINVVMTSTATIDCEPPIVSNVEVTNLTASSADVTFTINEQARAQVYYGTSCGSTPLLASSRQYLTDHVVDLDKLSKNTTYFFTLEVDDEAGNRTILDNGGACFTFTTFDRRDYFTQLFSPNGFDLDGKALTLTPTQNIHKFTACVEPISALPVSTADLNSMPMGDDAYQMIPLTDGKSVSLFGVNYSTLFVGSNGFVTFNSGDTDYTESLAEHFQVPRISVLFDDFNPTSAGIKWRQFSDRVVVTWPGVPEYGQSNSNTFQLIMRFDGIIQMAWLGIGTVDGLVGISQGGGLPAEYQASDLSAYSACTGLPEKAFHPNPANLETDASVIQTLSWMAGWRATSHELYVGPAADQLVLEGTLAGTSFPLDVLGNEHTYFWRIDEVNASGRVTGDVWSFTTRHLKTDFDSDGDVDMSDFAHLQLCFSGTDIPQNQSECLSARLDEDSDVDSDDVELFRNCLSGANQLALGTCLP